MAISAKIKSIFEKTRKSCWIMIDRYYPTTSADRYEITDQLLLENIKEDDVIIEAGCGHRELEYKEARLNAHRFILIGVDLLVEDVLANDAIDMGVVANLDGMPFKNNSADKIVSRMVIEHLEDPDSFFREASLILKPKGELIVLTPNKYGLVTLASRLVPDSFHPWLLKRLAGVSSSDVFPKYYRANTIRSLDKLARKWGMHRDEYLTCQPPPYGFVFSRIICLMAILYFTIISKYECLAFLRGVIIARYVKHEHES